MEQIKQKVIYALGFFDGVHLGHQALLRTCRVLAAQNAAVAGVVTFQQHPQTLVCGNAPRLICSPEDRNALLRRYGAEKIVSLPFDEALRSMPWQDFLRMLQRDHAAAGFVCGFDFRFGRKGEGSAETLTQYCEEHGLFCEVVPEERLGGQVVSSTAIRQHLQQDAFEKATAMLGHGYVLSGEVVSGRKLGSTIGIPTANLQLNEALAKPQNGVYAAKAWVDGTMYFAVTNIGNRPTVGGHRVTVESWLLDFSGDLYGKKLQLELLSFLRPEKKFDSLEQLREEIRKNAADARKILGKC